jgi:hypothetical protein
VLVFRTPPLTADVEVAGYLKVAHAVTPSTRHGQLLGEHPPTSDYPLGAMNVQTASCAHATATAAPRVLMAGAIWGSPEPCPTRILQRTSYSRGHLEQ